MTELDKGVIIRHLGENESIFNSSMLLVTEFERNVSIKGVIINKMVHKNDKNIRVGGPCELHCVTTLHNIPNIAGS